jgi:hypothetical protein
MIGLETMTTQTQEQTDMPEKDLAEKNVPEKNVPEKNVPEKNVPETGVSEYPFSISGRPDFSRLSVQLPKEGMIKAESSAMISMDSNISMKTKLKGGFKSF